METIRCTKAELAALTDAGLIIVIGSGPAWDGRSLNWVIVEVIGG